MKFTKIRTVIISFALAMALLVPLSANAQMDPRAKALGRLALYGTVGGGLLGVAALAFDAPGRSPFVGMSLGLYAGIIFGSYVVITHAVKKHRESLPPGEGDDEYYPETPDSPYEFGGEEGYYEDEGGGGEAPAEEGGGEQFWNPYWEMQRTSINFGKLNRKPRSDQMNTSSPTIYLNLLRITF
jgi:hypothetical protein